MALTMTRTRTQTTLTRLVKLLAGLNGELEFVKWLLDEMPDHQEALTVRLEGLDNESGRGSGDTSAVQPGTSSGRGGSTRPKKTRRAVQRYIKSLQET